MSDSRNTFEFKREVVRNFQQKVLNLENVKYDFRKWDNLWNIYDSCMWVAVHLHHDQDQILRCLRNMKVEQIQQIFTTTGNQIAELQFEELAVLYGQLSWEESPKRSCTLFHKDMHRNKLRPRCVFSNSAVWKMSTTFRIWKSLPTRQKQHFCLNFRTQRIGQSHWRTFRARVKGFF